MCELGALLWPAVVSQNTLLTERVERATAELTLKLVHLLTQKMCQYTSLHVRSRSEEFALEELLWQ